MDQSGSKKNDLDPFMIPMITGPDRIHSSLEVILYFTKNLSLSLSIKSEPDHFPGDKTNCGMNTNLPGPFAMGLPPLKTSYRSREGANENSDLGQFLIHGSHV